MHALILQRNPLPLSHNQEIVMIKQIFLAASMVSFILACNTKKQEKTTSANDESSVGFILKSPAQTGVHFSNILTEDDQINYLNNEAVYHGAGVGVLDINNDGKMDLFFASNQGDNKLYLNQGNFKFEDITSSAGVAGGAEWAGGVSIVDLNADGWDDIYISCHLSAEESLRKNKLYINQKNNTFIESAEKYGLADASRSIHAVFFDYDLDNDLDAFILNQPPSDYQSRNNIIAPDLKFSNHFYINESEQFVDKTAELGLIQSGYCLSASVSDYNNDGRPDIFISNDYLVPDALMMNIEDNGFHNIINTAFKHTSQFSMGSDAADINNDGWVDIYSADMVAEDHYRNKANMSGMNPEKFWKLISSGFQYQYMFNCLQLNKGNGYFSDIAQLSGISNTDWSWTPLFVDLDNDGYRDLYVTNGFRRDVRNKDFDHLRSEYFENRNNPNYKGEKFAHATDLLDRAPSVKLVNYVFKNNGDLSFKKMAKSWNMNQASFSNGAAYADLDNDGDLDLVVNNINDPAFIYENMNDSKTNRYIRLNLKGEGKNTRSIGARANIYYSGKMQTADVNNNRGYMSASEYILHFGLGDVKTIDSIIVRWPSGKALKLENIKTNQVLDLNEIDSKFKLPNQLNQNSQYTYTHEITDKIGLNIRHQENNYDDYKKEVLMPHKMSTLGPCLTVSDVNGDHLEDFYLGGSAGQSGQLAIQNQDNTFQIKTIPAFLQNKQSEDSDAVFFDKDGDGDMDLYVASGSNEFELNSKLFLDKLYENDGKGNFKDLSSELPKITVSKGLVKAFDMDGDGDIDIFLGGRQVPGKYGKSVPSFILLNENGKFVDRTATLCPEMTGEYGNVSCGNYTDIDRDGDQDLIIGGEWMNIKILINDGKGKFSDQSASWNTNQLSGWWNTITATDLDQDGDPDILLGNLGLNIKFKASPEKPFYVYLNDFDKNGSWDTYLGSYDADGKLYPVRGRQCSSEQMPFIKEKFANYESFAKASLEEVLEGKLDNTIIKKVNEFRSGVLMNDQKKSFKFIPFPNEAQIAPIQDFVLTDVNLDGKIDVLYAGNYFNREVETTRSDAGTGGILMGKGTGEFTELPSYLNGMYLNGDVRKMKKIKIGQNECIIVANNNGPIQMNIIQSRK